jgi:hypothetical protein
MDGAKNLFGIKKQEPKNDPLVNPYGVNQPIVNPYVPYQVPNNEPIHYQHGNLVPNGVPDSNINNIYPSQYYNLPVPNTTDVNAIPSAATDNPSDLPNFNDIMSNTNDINSKVDPNNPYPTFK